MGNLIKQEKMKSAYKTKADNKIKADHSAKTEKNAETEQNAKTKKSAKTKQNAAYATKGVIHMNATENRSLLNNNVIGFRELRSRISEVIETVVTGYNVVISGNVKKNSRKTAAIISTKMLDEILEIYRFNTTINFDKETSQFEVILNEIGIYGCGDTRQEAIEITTDMAMDIAADYFKNAEMYARIPDEKIKYPYFLRIRNCSDRDEVKKVLGLV